LSAISSSDPRVSVIVPVFNRRQFLVRCLASIEATQHPNLEVLFIDDGSSDGSWELIQQLALARGAWVRALRHPGHHNRGISASRNLGIAEATGRYLAFLDSDDEYHPHRFDHCLRTLASDPGLQAVYEPVLIERDNDQTPVSIPSAATIRRCQQAPLDWLFCADWWHTSGITLRRDFLTLYGSFRPDLPVAEDTELWMRIAATGAIQCCQQEQPVATVRRHQQGHSWDGYSAAKSTRFYRKALLAALGSIRNHPQLYAPAAVETLRSRYRKAVEDDLAMLAGLPSLKEVARLVLEASAQQPGALWNRRSLGNLLSWRRWR
jgi:glycosyltransferase involved in cell wall biosynthesis